MVDDVWLLEQEGKPGLYTFQVLTWTFVPSQGLLNFFVYTRPTYLRWRKVFPERSRFWALYKAAALEAPARKARSLHPTLSTLMTRSSLSRQSPSNDAMDTVERKADATAEKVAVEENDEPPTETETERLGNSLQSLEPHE